MDAFTIATGYELIKIAKREGWLDHAIDWFRTKNKVILLGSTGAGKSQFLDSVDDILAPARSHAARTEFVTVTRFDLNGALVDFIDTPGQLEHKPIRGDALKQAIKINLKGIINFVSYGYHEYGGMHVSNVIENGHAKPNFLDEHRKREIELLGEWAPLMSTEWVLTVVTKADIWYDDQQEVIRYYSRGPYHDQLKGLFPNAHHFVRPYSSISRRFYSQLPGVACPRFRRHRVRCFHGTGGASWSGGSLRESSSLRLCA